MLMNDAVVHAKLLTAFHKRYGIIPDYEHILECNYRRLIGSGNTVFDIGAHEGRHTRIFSEIVGPQGAVWAFEPLPVQFSTLQELNLGRHVKLFNAAVSDYSGWASFVHARGTPSESGLRQRVFNAPDLADPQTIQVNIIRIDDFLEQITSLHYVKVDVEGGEIGCLRGGVNALRRWRPFVTVEYGAQGYSVYGHTRRTLFDFAESIGFVVGDLFGAVCPDLETWDVVCDRVYWDWFLVPRERVVEWQACLLG
jgi:FkbM family methyltransferase